MMDVNPDLEMEMADNLESGSILTFAIESALSVYHQQIAPFTVNTAVTLITSGQ